MWFFFHNQRYRLDRTLCHNLFPKTSKKNSNIFSNTSWYNLRKKKFKYFFQRKHICSPFVLPAAPSEWRPRSLEAAPHPHNLAPYSAPLAAPALPSEPCYVTTDSHESHPAPPTIIIIIIIIIMIIILLYILCRSLRLLRQVHLAT